MQHTLSTRALVKSTCLALAIAGIALVSFILPAEYNIDPLGIGNKLGLTALATATPGVNSVATTEAVNASDYVEVTVPAGRGVEFKFAMQQFKTMQYHWVTDGTALFFDLHGEPEGDTSGYFESYAIATLREMKGSYTTPFAGVHGWYWKNTSDQAVTISLTVSGEYQLLGLK